MTARRRPSLVSTAPPTSPAGDGVDEGGLSLRATVEGVLLPVRVVPRAGSTALEGAVDGALRVRLTAPPVARAANAALLALLADRLALPKSALALAGGATARHKTVLVRGLTVDEVRARLGG